MKRSKINQTTISTNDLRFKFDILLTALKKRKNLVLTYRNKPIATISPFLEHDDSYNDDDPFFKLCDIAEPAGDIKPEGIDREIFKKWITQAC